MSAIRVLLVEDHTLVREGTIALLAGQPDIKVVGTAANAPDALKAIADTRPDVVVLDIRIPGGGIQVASRAAHGAPGVRVLVLSAYGQADYVASMSNAGVSGYLLKSASAEALADAIRKVHAGEKVFDPQLEPLPDPLPRATLEDVSAILPLTLRELDVLRHLAAGAANKEIAHALGVSTKTIEAHLSSIYSKLNVRSRTEAVVRAARAGIIAVDHGVG